MKTFVLLNIHDSFTKKLIVRCDRLRVVLVQFCTLCLQKKKLFIHTTLYRSDSSLYVCHFGSIVCDILKK